MAGTKISALPAASSVAAADLVPIVSGGVNESATPELLAVYTVDAKMPFSPVDPATSTATTITALSAALAASTDGGTIDLRPGTYLWDLEGGLDDGVTLRGGTGVVIEFSDSTPDYPLLIQGTEGSHTALTANATAGAYTVALPTGEGANFAVDDVVGLISTTVVAGTGGRARELHQVLSIATDTLTLDAPLNFSYLTAATAEFFKVTPKKDITIEGVTLTWNAADPVKMRGPLISRAIRCHFKDITVVNGPGITVDDAINCSITNVTIDGSKEYASAYLAGSYGITVSGSGHGTVVNGGTIRATRHAATTLYYSSGGNDYTGPFDTTFANLIGWGGPESFSVFDTHSYAHDTLFIGCKAIGPGQAATPCFQDRGVRTKIDACSGRGANRGITLTTDSVDCTIQGTDLRDINTGTTPGGVLISGAGARVFGCRFKNVTAGVVIGTTATNALVEDCEFAGTYTYGIQDSSSADIGQISRNNLFRIGTSEGSIAHLAFRGHIIEPVFTGTVGFPGFTNTNARITKGISPPTTVTYAATVTPQPTLVNCIEVTQTGNITIANPSANYLIKGVTLRVILIQDGTGGRTVTWGAGYRPITAAVTTLNKANVWDFQYNGTSLLEISAAAGI